MTQTFKVHKFRNRDWFYISDGGVCASYLWQDGYTYPFVLGLCKGTWSKKYVAQKFLMDYERKQMSDTKVRLDQVTKDIELLQTEAAELAKKIEGEKNYIFKLGDVCLNQTDVLYGYEDNLRFIVENRDNKLFSVNRFGRYMTTEQKDFEIYRYKKVGVLGDYIN